MAGSTLRVEIYDKVVIKHARNRLGIRANKREVQRYEAYNSRYLCPIIARSMDFSFVVMPRVKIPSLFKRMRYARYLRMVLHPYRINDIHWYNVGELDGKPVLYDYGDSWFSFRMWMRPVQSRYGAQ